MNSVVQTVGDSPFTDIIPLYDFIMNIEDLNMQEKLLLNYLIGEQKEDDEYFDLMPEHFYENCRWGEFIGSMTLLRATTRLYDKGYLKDKMTSLSHKYVKLNTTRILDVYDNYQQNKFNL